MKKLFLMLVVLFIALCLFVSCDDDSSDKEPVSTWKYVTSREDGIYTYTVAFYDDGIVKQTESLQNQEGGSIMTGTYTASSETTGTMTITIDNVSRTDNYLIDGNLLIIESGDEQYTYVRVNANKQAVSTWSATNFISSTETRIITVVLYDDGTLTYTINNIYGTDDETIDPSVGIYSAESNTNGTFTVVTADGNVPGSYTIDGNKMTVSGQEKDIVLTKVEE
ncbi:MAG: hypothetical protein IJ836_07405 [Spirochaetales bacterium]|nr:hypothetical protein [Spirochaetales bacterium]